MPSKPIKTTFVISNKLEAEQFEQVKALYAEAQKVKNGNFDARPESMDQNLADWKKNGFEPHYILAYSSMKGSKTLVGFTFSHIENDEDLILDYAASLFPDEAAVFEEIETVKASALADKKKDEQVKTLEKKKKTTGIKGLGTKLMSILFKEAAEKEITAISLVASHNTNQFYSKCGFSVDDVVNDGIKRVYMHNADVINTAKKLKSKCSQDGYNKALQCAA